MGQVADAVESSPVGALLSPRKPGAVDPLRAGGSATVSGIGALPFKQTSPRSSTLCAGLAAPSSQAPTEGLLVSQLGVVAALQSVASVRMDRAPDVHVLMVTAPLMSTERAGDVDRVGSILGSTVWGQPHLVARVGEKESATQ